MVKLLYGKKGTGKTKALVDAANNSLSKECKGDVVFIDDSSQLMYDLRHEIRFINVSEFPIKCATAFLGFICGIISEDYDISKIFIDGLTYIVKQKTDSLQEFFDGLKQVSSKFNIEFFVSINGEIETIPDYLKEFIE